MPKRIRASACLFCLLLCGQKMATGECPADSNFKDYRIGSVAIRTPFDALHLGFVEKSRTEWLARIGVKPGDPYSAKNIDAARDALETDAFSAPIDFGFPVNGSVTAVFARNCREENGQMLVDLQFYAISARVPSFWSHSFESKREDLTDPAKPAGVAKRTFAVSPLGGYSASSKLFGGLRVSAPQWKALKSAEADGYASRHVRALNASVATGAEPNWETLERIDARGGYRFSDQPFGKEHFQGGMVYAEVRAATGSIGENGPVLRYGMTVEGGNRQSSGAAEPGVIRNSSHGALKAYAGLTYRSVHHGLNLSYAFMAGRAGTGASVDYRKHLADGAWSAAWVRNHRAVEFDTRASFGWIQNLHGVPLAERFFGGNVEQNFLPDASWVIRSQPMIRSMPWNQLRGTGFGADRFAAGSVALGYTLWRKTLIPETLLSQPKFLDRVDAAQNGAEEILTSWYWTNDPEVQKDPVFEKARSGIEPLQSAFDKVKPVFAAIAPPANLKDKFDECSDNMDQAVLDLDDVRTRAKPIALITNNTGNVAKSASCLMALGKRIGNLAFQQASTMICSSRDGMSKTLREGNSRKKSEKKAHQDLAMAKRSIHTLFHETNLLSISPVGIADIVRLGPRNPGQDQARIGYGAGLRFTLASTVRLTGGYALLHRRRIGESRGAWFFDLEVLDIFGR